jgi:hypothetical protein
VSRQILKAYSVKKPYGNRQAQYLATRNPNRRPIVKHEEGVQKQLCHYLKLQYPNVIFKSDTSSGRWEYSRKELYNKLVFQSSKSMPDLFIYEPVQHGSKHYCGLALEIKKEGTSVIMKIGPRKGMLSTDAHIQEQALMLKTLIKKGYYANFAVGFDEAKKIIDWYFGIKNPVNSTLQF